ncbi:hypothetical protein ACP4OV_018411 [Aristida adscensionis]
MAGNPRLPAPGGEDRLSDLPDGIVEHLLSFLPAPDAARCSVLSRRWRGAWAHAAALNFSDGPPHQARLLAVARAALARYGAPGVPALRVVVGCESNLGPATAAWLAEAMERVVGSVSVTVTAPGPLDELALPAHLRAKSISLTLSGVIFQHGTLVLPEPGESASFCGLMELSLSIARLQEGVRPLGEFLSSCCPGLRKLSLTKVSGGMVGNGGLRVWPLVLRLDQLEELKLDRVESLTKLDVVSASLRALVVRSCFGYLAQWDIDTVVDISAPKLEDVSWSGSLPKHLNFLTGSGCIRRLDGIYLYLPGKEFRSAGALRLLEMCYGANQLSVCIDIPDYTTPSMITREEMDHVPQLPNARVLFLRVVAVLRFISCPIAPSIFSFLRRCPNLTRLHIDLSMLHQFSRLNPGDVMVPDDDEVKEAELWQSPSCDLCKVQRDQLELDSLRDIRVSGFMGTVHELELADLLFGAGAARPALERISISFPKGSHQGSVVRGAEAMESAFRRLFAPVDPVDPVDPLRQHVHGIGEKMKAKFPLVGGCWETNGGEGALTWTKT